MRVHIVLRKLRICARWWFAGVFAMPRANGFQTKARRQAHFADHGGDFGNCTIVEYEQMADHFLTEPLRAGVIECRRRSSGALIRYDQTTGAFGILSTDGIIRTYFKPIPYWRIPPGYVLPGNCHGHLDNVAYFHAECAR